MADSVNKIRIPNMDETELAAFLTRKNACLEGAGRVDGMDLSTAWVTSMCGWDMYWMVRRLRVSGYISYCGIDISRGVQEVLQSRLLWLTGPMGEEDNEQKAMAEFLRSRFEVVD